jgi:N-acetylglucosaminyldiphosphoundecaprenol N-acetyl-beta-D-mannosaminyltransferase
VKENVMAGNNGAGVPRVGAPIAILGVPFDNVTTAQTVALVEAMIASKRPHYLATANVDFAVQALHDVELRRILLDAHLVVCDGAPLVWASRWLGNPLPERVAGSDLVPLLLRLAEAKGYRVFFLGGKESTVQRALAKLRETLPKLNVVGFLSPPFAPLLEMDHEGICKVLRQAKPDLMFVSFGCPKQEKWLNLNYRQAGVPVGIGVGATIDFLAGDMKRAPVWMQKCGLEWLFRLLQEPRRLFRRYFKDLWVFGWAILQQTWQMRRRRSSQEGRSLATVTAAPDATLTRVRFEGRLDAAAVHANEGLWGRLASGQTHVIVDLAGVPFVDSTGVGRLVRLQKDLREAGRQLVVAGAGDQVRQALQKMGLAEFLPLVADSEAAKAMVAQRASERAAVVTVNTPGQTGPLAWQGEVTVVNRDDVWRVTEAHLRGASGAVEIDLAGVRFVDTAGVGLMVRAKKEARLRGLECRFTAPQATVRNVVRTLQLEDYLFRQAA